MGMGQFQGMFNKEHKAGGLTCNDFKRTQTKNLQRGSKNKKNKPSRRKVDREKTG